MKISSTAATTNLNLQAKSAQDKNTSPGAKSTDNSAVQLDISSDVKLAHNQVSQHASVDMDKVQQFKQAIANNELELDLDSLIDQFVARELPEE